MSKTIAILRTGGVGDVILSTVSINIIKDNLPDAKILWFGRAPTNSLIKQVFTDVDVFEITSQNSYTENLSLIKHSAKNIDAIIDLQNSSRTIILGRLAAIHFKCTYTSWNKYSIERSLLVFQSRFRGRKLIFDFLTRELPNRYEAMASCTWRALNKIGVNSLNDKKYTPHFKSLNSEKKKEIVTICLGAKFLTKALPLPWIRKSIENIIANNITRKIYLLGEENQIKNGEILLKEYSRKVEIINLCGSTTLFEAAKILQESFFAIVNDSGLAHLSEAVNTPVIMFFGPTHEKFGYRPYLNNSHAISVDIGCRPCNKNGDVACRYNDHACSFLLNETAFFNLITETYNV